MAGQLRGVGATGIAVGIATAAPMAKEVSQAGNIDAEDLMFRPQQPQGGAREQGLAAYGCQSAALTDTASTFTRTSPAFGAGLPASAIRRVCGGPYSS
jgi:hypothetical protein